MLGSGCALAIGGSCGPAKGSTSGLASGSGFALASGSGFAVAGRWVREQVPHVSWRAMERERGSRVDCAWGWRPVGARGVRFSPCQAVRPAVSDAVYGLLRASPGVPGGSPVMWSDPRRGPAAGRLREDRSGSDRRPHRGATSAAHADPPTASRHIPGPTRVRGREPSHLRGLKPEPPATAKPSHLRGRSPSRAATAKPSHLRGRSPSPAARAKPERACEARGRAIASRRRARCPAGAGPFVAPKAPPFARRSRAICRPVRAGLRPAPPAIPPRTLPQPPPRPPGSPRSVRCPPRRHPQRHRPVQPAPVC
jgi:hypothetical protein